MIKLENYEVMGWEHAIRGMRNPMNSWEKSDSEPGCEIVPGSHNVCRECDNHFRINGNFMCSIDCTPSCVLGPNDYVLMMKLVKGGPVHAKYRRMITVYVDITAPLYWWKEFDTYKVGTVANSCSTMHKIHEKEFDNRDFSTEHLIGRKGMWDIAEEDIYKFNDDDCDWWGNNVMNHIINVLNFYREKYLNTKDKKYWWQMIQLLPSSYNQKRTVMLNYEVLSNIYESRKNHKLDEWREFCDWIKELPYNEIITGEVKNG